MPKRAAEVVILEKIRELNEELTGTLDYDVASGCTDAIHALCEVLEQIPIRDTREATATLREILEQRPATEIAGRPALPYTAISHTISLLS